MTAGAPNSVRVTVITRVDCHLCQDAEATIARLADELDFAWRAVDVDADHQLTDRFGDRVPVILLDGREHGYWRVEEDRLRAALRRTEPSAGRRADALGGAVTGRLGRRERTVRDL